MFVQPMVITNTEGGMGITKLHKFIYIFFISPTCARNVLAKVADDQTIVHATADNSPVFGRWQVLILYPYFHRMSLKHWPSEFSSTFIIYTVLTAAGSSSEESLVFS